MQWLTAHIRPTAAFGTALKGDTLFGQLCWALRHRTSEAGLTERLEGYGAGQPFLLVADAFPHGLLPRPELPPVDDGNPEDRKLNKNKRWVPVAAFAQPLESALQQAVAGPNLGPDPDKATPPWQEGVQAHNSISRLTSTTGNGADPYQMPRLWPAVGLTLDVHFVLDEARLSRALLQTLLADIGAFGFGRDASIGLGRFQVEGWSEGRPTHAPQADALLTLAPCAPQGGNWVAQRCLYRPFTRFGRHGAEAATSGQEYKTPLLLADTAAVLTPATMDAGALFVGQGLGGSGRLSRAVPATVHQGYAPVLPVQLPKGLPGGRA